MSQIKNIVASVLCDETFNLDYIEKELGYIATRLYGFPSLKIKLDVKDLCHVFANGKLVILGETTLENTLSLVERYAKLLQNIGYKAECSNFKIVNIVACYDYEKSVNLIRLSQKKSLQYFPEIFPAVRYRLEDLKITVNIFRSGKCVFLGAATFGKLDLALIKLIELLQWNELKPT